MEVIKSSISRKASLRDFPSREAEDDLVGRNVSRHRESQRWEPRGSQTSPASRRSGVFIKQIARLP